MKYGIATKMCPPVVVSAARTASTKSRPTSIAESLLNRPLRHDAAYLESTAAEEAAHAVVGCALGARICYARTVPDGEVRFSNFNQLSPVSRAAICLAGSVARKPAEVDLALISGKPDALKWTISNGDLEALGLGGRIVDHRSLEVLREAAQIAGAYLAAHRHRFLKIKDALLRGSGALEGSDVEALMESDLDLSPRDPTREPPRLINYPGF